MKLTKILPIVFIGLLFVICAGCVSPEIDDSKIMTQTPIITQTPTISTIPTQEETGVVSKDIIGIWYSEKSYGVGYTKYTFDKDYAYYEKYNDATSENSNKDFYLDVKSGELKPYDKKLNYRYEYAWEIYDKNHINVGNKLFTYDKTKNTLTDNGGYVYHKYLLDTDNKNPHNSDDYIESGNYYLEDDNGRSFTETLWKGDISQFVDRLTGSQWIQHVRWAYSPTYHGLELNYFKNYLTVDEIISGEYDTLIDCDDLAILMARGLHEMSINVCILVFENHMDVGIHKDDLSKINSPRPPFGLDGNYYAVYQSPDEIMYDDYYLIDIAHRTGDIDIGRKCTQTGFSYDEELLKIIPLGET